MKNKKKGFTLIELIAVIAILAILGAVLVPKILGYQNKAKRSNIQTSAKTIVHAIQAYNADAVTPLVVTATLADSISSINEQGTIIDTTKDEYTKLSGLSLKEIAAASQGKFTYNGTTVTVIAADADTAASELQ